jgi:hypothetical protein
MIAKTRISRINTEGNHITVPSCNSRLKWMQRTNILCWRRVHAQVHSIIALNRLNVWNLLFVEEEVELSPMIFATICCADEIEPVILKLNSETTSTDWLKKGLKKRGWWRDQLQSHSVVDVFNLQYASIWILEFATVFSHLLFWGRATVNFLSNKKENQESVTIWCRLVTDFGGEVDRTENSKLKQRRENRTQITTTKITELNAFEVCSWRWTFLFNTGQHNTAPDIYFYCGVHTPFSLLCLCLNVWSGVICRFYPALEAEEKKRTRQK